MEQRQRGASSARFVLPVLFATALTSCGDSGAGAGAAGGAGPDTGGAGATGAGANGTGGAGASGMTGGSGGSTGGAGGSTEEPTTTTGGGGAGTGGGSMGCGMPTPAGTTTKSLTVDGEERTYLLVVPTALDGLTPVPVLMGFHGGSGTSEAAAQQYGLTGPEPALYVYPQANLHPTAGGVAWELEENTDDIALVDAILIDLEQSHCIDTERVFAAGQSNGAFFTNLLACSRPESFRAIASAAGGGPWTNCGDAVAAMIVHGENDTTVPLEQGIASRDYWLAANGCTGAASTPVEPSPCVEYQGCENPVRWCQHEGGHPWPAFAGDGIRNFFFGL
ncbi:MAG: prolyl oligopeptidase family serine peptidase [Polyangiaceae bacterium]|nr:prolyl oligopeptidase family serine peptidase [Polyangiaceae bacterium]